MTDDAERRARQDRATDEMLAAEEARTRAAPKPKAPPGWYPHPSMAHTLRYWDGTAWTEHVAPASPARAQQVVRPMAPGTSKPSAGRRFGFIVAGMLIGWLLVGTFTGVILDIVLALLGVSEDATFWIVGVWVLACLLGGGLIGYNMADRRKPRRR